MKVQSKISLLSLYRGEIRLWRVTGAYGTCLNLRILFYESTSTHRSIRRIIFLCEVLSSYPRSVNKRIRSLDIFEKCVEKKHTAATAVYAVHRPLRPSPPLADKNPFREWNMWETRPPRGIILNYVCSHLSDRGRRFHLVALRPFVNLARDPGGPAILLPFSRFVPDAFFGA